MGDEPLLVGIDVGTTNIKAVIFDRHGRLVAAGSRKTPVHYPQPGWAYFPATRNLGHDGGRAHAAVAQ